MRDEALKEEHTGEIIIERRITQERRNNFVPSSLFFIFLFGIIFFCI